MALPTAIVLGGVAAVGVPWLARAVDLTQADWLEGTAVRLPLAGLGLHWSWPVFCVVTLIVWGVLRASRTR